MKNTTAILILLTMAIGCSTTATVKLRDGREYEGVITDSNAEWIYIDRDPGTPMDVRRENVTSIDHPGDIHFIIGSVIAGLGVANLAVNADECGEDGCFSMCAVAITPLAVGLGVGTWGLVVWLDSKGTAGQEDKPFKSRRTSAFGLKYELRARRQMPSFAFCRPTFRGCPGRRSFKPGTSSANQPKKRWKRSSPPPRNGGSS